MKIFYFSATGNSLHVALSLGGEVLPVVKCIESGSLCHTADVIGFVFPVHFGQVAPPMIDFLKLADLHAHYFFLIATYGHYPANAMQQFNSLLREKGLKTDYQNGVEMVDTWLPRFDVDAEISLLPSRKVEEHISKICKDIENRRKKILPFKFLPFIVGFFERRIKYRNICRKFIVNEACNGCGICRKVCPQQNVQIEAGLPQFGHSCISCLACVHLCPQCAIHFYGEKSKKRFHHPALSLTQLMNGIK